jgi:hypothetical protein
LEYRGGPNWSIESTGENAIYGVKLLTLKPLKNLQLRQSSKGAKTLPEVILAKNQRHGHKLMKKTGRLGRGRKTQQHSAGVAFSARVRVRMDFKVCCVRINMLGSRLKP